MDAWTQMHNTAQDKIKAHSEKPFEYGDHHWTQTENKARLVKLCALLFPLVFAD